jgi:hypothetical protein
VETDQGQGYLKAIGNPEGVHTLACEFVGTQLAAWLGLSVLEFHIIEVDDVVEIWFFNAAGELEGSALPGPAFITRREQGDSWSGEERQLRQVVNPEDISRLVVLDTWTLNCDRHGPREKDASAQPRINRQNVFLSEEAPAGKFCLKAIDHTHCFTCGWPLTTGLHSLDKIRDARVFGRFPEFVSFLDRDVVRDTLGRLQQIERAVIASMMQSIPPAWEVRREVQEAWIELIFRRAMFVADTLEDKLWPQAELDFGDGEEQSP